MKEDTEQVLELMEAYCTGVDFAIQVMKNRSTLPLEFKSQSIGLCLILLIWEVICLFQSKRTRRGIRF